MPNPIPPQHHGAMMPMVRSDRDRVPRPGDDGWLTPTIEDAHHPANLAGEANLYEAHFRRDLDTFHYSRRVASQLHDVQEDMENDPDPSAQPKQLSWKQRLKHVTWAWFTMSMATGGIASVIAQVPYRFHGLRTIGLVFFLFNIVLYILLFCLIIARFTLYPYMFKASFTHPTESLFVPAVAVSFGTILINITQYGFGAVGWWLNKAVLVLFWLDAALAVVLSILIYFILWSTQTFTIARMTPIWIFPAYPLLIIGPHAANLSKKLSDPIEAIQVIVGGFTIQGIGFLVSLTIYSAFVYRLMTQKIPPEPLRPGMFVSVGPSAFTVAGTIGMAENLAQILPHLPEEHYMGVDGVLAASILRIIATWSCLWLWGLAWWFFFISLLSNLVCLQRKHQMPFAMTWFSFIFPQTALTTATFMVAEAFDVVAIRVVGCVMTGLLVVVWVLVVSMMVRAVVLKQILWPEKGEDRNEGGFKMKQDEEGKERGKDREMESPEGSEKLRGDASV